MSPVTEQAVLLHTAGNSIRLIQASSLLDVLQYDFTMLRSRVVWFVFFSSRRRHTRLQGDWSSDVCSSDLVDREEGFNGYVTVAVENLPARVTAVAALENPLDQPPLPNGGKLERYVARQQRTAKIGRASCRERV